MISSYFSIDIIFTAIPEQEVPDPEIFLGIPASASAAAFNPNDINTLLSNFVEK